MLFVNILELGRKKRNATEFFRNPQSEANMMKMNGGGKNNNSVRVVDNNRQQLNNNKSEGNYELDEHEDFVERLRENSMRKKILILEG